jgi:hypothetical protein
LERSDRIFAGCTRPCCGSGQLEQAVEDAENRAFDVETAALRPGLNPDQARELARQEWCNEGTTWNPTTGR